MDGKHTVIVELVIGNVTEFIKFFVDFVVGKPWIGRPKTRLAKVREEGQRRACSFFKHGDSWVHSSGQCRNPHHNASYYFKPLKEQELREKLEAAKVTAMMEVNSALKPKSSNPTEAEKAGQAVIEMFAKITRDFAVDLAKAKAEDAKAASDTAQSERDWVAKMAAKAIAQALAEHAHQLVA